MHWWDIRGSQSEWEAGEQNLEYTGRYQAPRGSRRCSGDGEEHRISHLLTTA